MENNVFSVILARHTLPSAAIRMYTNNHIGFDDLLIFFLVQILIIHKSLNSSTNPEHNLHMQFQSLCCREGFSGDSGEGSFAFHKPTNTFDK